MATPTFINFSRFQGDPIQAIENLILQVCPRWDSHLVRSVQLDISSDPYDGGLEAVSEQQPCQTIADVRQVVDNGYPFGLVFVARPARAEFNVVLHDKGHNGFSLTASIESSMLYHKDAVFPESGRWFKGWLSSLIATLRPTVCAYGNTFVMDPTADFSQVLEALRRPRYFALDAEDVLSRLRSGVLFDLPPPVIYAIRMDIVSAPEMWSILEKQSRPPHLKYEMTAGFHLLSNL